MARRETLPLEGWVTYDPYWDRLTVRFSAGPVATVVELDEDLWASFDATGSATEVAAASATMGRSLQWRQLLRATSGSDVVELLDDLDDQGRKADSDKVVITVPVVDELRRNWLAMIACDRTGELVATHWRDHLAPVSITPQPTLIERLGRLRTKLDDFANVLDGEVAALVARPVIPVLAGVRRTQTMATWAAASSPARRRFSFSLPEDIARLAGAKVDGTGSIDGPRISLAVVPEQTTSVALLAVSIISPDGEVVAGPVAFERNTRYGVNEAVVDLEESPVDSTMEDADVAIDLRSVGFTLEFSTVEAR